ncbi:MAG: glycoside hydrolase family 6 protein [Patescibacteria group bacterium]|nr:glycoside hydrolase family 6 protein [Patescibacteria group bacterium]
MTHSSRGFGPNPLRSFFLILGLLLAGCAPLLTPAVAEAAPAIDVWWPTDGAHVAGLQPFKAMVAGLDVANYQMYWRVDGGQWNRMGNTYTDYQHKEASVDLSHWTWHGSGPYVVDFSARQGGNELAETSVRLYVDNGLPAGGAAAAPAAQGAAPQLLAAPAAPAAPPFYVDPDSAAAKQADAWQSADPADASLMRTLAASATATWFGDWNGNVAADVAALVAKARSAGQAPVLVAYAIPERDCGGFSAGGVNTPAGYKAWIDAFASGLGSSDATVILEPDALAGMNCLSSADQATRLALLAYAVSAVKRDGNAKVYLDAGHEGWVDAGTMASRLSAAGVSAAAGFALNVSNYYPTAGEEAYGAQISSRTGGAHFVIDTSRSGNPSGMGGAWCNPAGAAIGQAPTTNTGNALVDAFLWAKVPGESDGYCNGGPGAGSWWPAGALALVKNAR